VVVYLAIINFLIKSERDNEIEEKSEDINKETSKLKDDNSKNTIMFVMLHEMAHLMTETIGHTQEFWTNFRRILGDAVQIGIYTSVNYASRPTPYCGMTITDSPI
jgi:hypothetical protein